MPHLEVDHLDRPYFVYGTLRPRCGNSRFWRDCRATARHDGDARAPGYRLVARGIPYAVRGDQWDKVLGALIYPADDYDDQIALRWSLDALEAHPDHYQRVATVVYARGLGRVAWIYTPIGWSPNGKHVPSGDYYDYLREEGHDPDRYPRANHAHRG